MVTKISTTEFENMWNAIVECNDFCPEWDKTHFGCGYQFTESEVENNKPNGWKELKNLISEIEKTSVVYYYCCEGLVKNTKKVCFIVYGDTAVHDVIRISIQLEKMHGHIESERDIERYLNIIGGTGSVGDLSAVVCPLFEER